jgi:hypothetical protein
MQMFRCGCGAILFFDNSRCLTCRRETGWCPNCRSIVAVNGTTGNYSCDRCKSALLKCTNNRELTVCNRFVLMQPGGRAPAYCDCCKFNRTIPDLTVAGNAERWGRLETAKRRMLYDLDMLNLKYGTAAEGFVPGLVFEFKTDKIIRDGQWQRIKNCEPITTGHADGVIIINICEADDVERERMRVNLHEPQRTLIGHFRHEIAHYFWDLLVKNRQEEACKAVFGDHTLDYGAAQRAYYDKGAPPNWQENYVSAYATMHPWEDFAETFGLYLDIVGTLDTAEAQGFSEMKMPAKDLELVLKRYTPMAIGMNEINRHMGLPDLVPEVFCPAVVKKLLWVHDLVAAGDVAGPQNGPSTGKGSNASRVINEPAGCAR